MGFLVLMTPWMTHAGVAHAQSHDGGSSNSAVAAVSPEAMTFDVATIRPNPHPPGWNMYFTIDGFTAKGVTLRQVIREAYAAYDGRVLGGPAWLDKDHFDIEAKLDAAEVRNFAQLSLPERRKMLQAMLADRFQLKVHREKQTVPAFALTVAKGGVKARKSNDGEGAQSSVKGYNCLITKSRAGLLEEQNCSMADLASSLEWAGRIVVDQTGLQDRYDFTLQWTPENVQRSSPDDSGNDGLQDKPYPFLFRALEQELGLKLEPTKTDIDVYVIDQAEQPSSN
ncbi:MAG TPA: TIGR03435 family protein [Acidobacteriaceae bacterium]